MTPAPQTDAPPVGEEIHFPGPSLLPIATAAGVTLSLLGLTLGLPVLIAGVVILLVATVRWIRSSRRETDELPLDG